MTVDLGATIQEIKEIDFTSYYAADGRYIPLDYALDYSTDNVNWTNITTVTGNLTTPVRVQTNTIGARYIRLTVNASQAGYTSCNVANFKVMSLQGGTMITGGNILAGSITADRLTANTITASSGLIADAAITSAKILDASITSAKIANATIVGADIASATITGANIASLDASKITTGTLSAQRIVYAGSLLAYSYPNTGFTPTENYWSTCINFANANNAVSATINLQTYAGLYKWDGTQLQTAGSVSGAVPAIVAASSYRLMKLVFSVTLLSSIFHPAVPIWQTLRLLCRY